MSKICIHHAIFLFLQKVDSANLESEITWKIMTILQSQVDFEQNLSSQNFNELKLIEGDSQQFLRSQVSDSVIKMKTCSQKSKIQQRQVSQSSKFSDIIISKKQQENGQNQQISQKNLKRNKFKEFLLSPFQNMNQDINQTNFLRIQSNSLEKQFVIQYLKQSQSQQKSPLDVKIQAQKAQDSFDIEQYQVSQSDFNKQEQQIYDRKNQKRRRLKSRKWQVIQNFDLFPKRKRYRSYSQEQKIQVLKKAQKLGIQQTSRLFDIPKKNIIRWIKKMQKNDLTRGRKPINPFMQIQLTKWIKSNIKSQIYVTQSDIRVKARQLSGQASFKASKGWLQKYFKRNKFIGQQLSQLLILKRAKKSLQLICQITNHKQNQKRKNK